MHPAVAGVLAGRRRQERKGKRREQEASERGTASAKAKPGELGCMPY
jgi:hypothetical protein